MKVLRRKMVSDVVVGETKKKVCQASINSQGYIVLRNYNPNDKDEDEIILLTAAETGAIFELMRTIEQLGHGLPF